MRTGSESASTTGLQSREFRAREFARGDRTRKPPNRARSFSGQKPCAVARRFQEAVHTSRAAREKPAQSPSTRGRRLRLQAKAVTRTSPTIVREHPGPGFAPESESPQTRSEGTVRNPSLERRLPSPPPRCGAGVLQIKPTPQTQWTYSRLANRKRKRQRALLPQRDRCCTSETGRGRCQRNSQSPNNWPSARGGRCGFAPRDRDERSGHRT